MFALFERMKRYEENDRIVSKYDSEDLYRRVYFINIIAAISTIVSTIIILFLPVNVFENQFIVTVNDWWSSRLQSLSETSTYLNIYAKPLGSRYALSFATNSIILTILILVHILNILFTSAKDFRRLTEYHIKSTVLYFFLGLIPLYFLLYFKVTPIDAKSNSGVLTKLFLTEWSVITMTGIMLGLFVAIYINIYCIAKLIKHREGENAS